MVEGVGNWHCPSGWLEAEEKGPCGHQLAARGSPQTGGAGAFVGGSAKPARRGDAGAPVSWGMETGPRPASPSPRAWAGVCVCPSECRVWGETEHPFSGNSRPGPKKTWAGSAVRARGGGLTSRRAASGEDAGAQGSQVAPDAPPRAVGTSTRGRRGARPSVPGPRPKVGVRTTPSTLGRGTFGRPTTTTSPPPHPHPHTTILKLWF